MRCARCGGTLQDDKGPAGSPSLALECEMCGMFPDDCRCQSKLGYTPRRHIHCTVCEEYFIATVDTSKKGWRGITVDPDREGDA